jgi:hypothetical protein
MDLLDMLDEQLLCPITCEPINNPVVLSDGHTYERKPILKWL